MLPLLGIPEMLSILFKLLNFWKKMGSRVKLSILEVSDLWTGQQLWKV